MSNNEKETWQRLGESREKPKGNGMISQDIGLSRDLVCGGVNHLSPR